MIVQQRQFRWKDELLPDPDPALHPNKVVEHYTELQYPEMLNSTITVASNTPELMIFDINLKNSSLG